MERKREFTSVEAEAWAVNFGLWLGRDVEDATVSKCMAAILVSLIAASGPIALTREQVLSNAHRPLRLRRTDERVIVFLDPEGPTDGPDGTNSA